MYGSAHQSPGIVTRAGRYALRIFSNSLWGATHAWLKLRHINNTLFAPSAEYGENHFLTGQISLAARQKLAEIFEKSPIIPFRREDYSPGYRWTYHADAQKVNQSFVHHDLRAKWSEYLAPAIEELAPYVSSALGAPWRIVRTRAYAITASAQSKFDTGANVWHTDQLHNAVAKALIYLTPVDTVWGTTEVRLRNGKEQVITGPEGTFLLFNPTTLIHRGIPPSKGRRETIEITFAVSPTLDKRPHMAGLNAVYPWMPWGTPSD
jgi:hypothetical protein